MPRPKPPENETPEDRFRRLAKSRAQEVMHRIRVLRHCANRSIYHYSDTQVQEIFSALRKELERAEEMFKREEKPPEINL